MMGLEWPPPMFMQDLQQKKQTFSNSTVGCWNIGATVAEFIKISFRCFIIFHGDVKETCCKSERNDSFQSL